jgi:hypothetical protein
MAEGIRQLDIGRPAGQEGDIPIDGVRPLSAQTAAGPEATERDRKISKQLPPHTCSGGARLDILPQGGAERIRLVINTVHPSTAWVARGRTILERLWRGRRVVRLGHDDGAALLRLPEVTGFQGATDRIGRPTFAQLACLAAQGGEVCVAQPLRELSYLFRLRGIGVPVFMPLLGHRRRVEDWMVVIDGHPNALDFGPADGGRHWRVVFDYRPAMALGPREHIVPYTMNPSALARGLHRDIPDIEVQPRAMRVLFAGTWDGPEYERDGLMRRLYGKMDRREAVLCFRAFPGEVFHADGWAWNRHLSGSFGIVLADSGRARVPQEDWLKTIGSADFLFCPPGQIMPLCYNIVEALAVGTVPITNYPEWLTPPLREGVECLTFTTADDIHEQMDRAMNMPHRAVAKMRRAARKYYEDHLELKGCFERLMRRGPGSLVLHAVDETISRLADVHGPAAGRRQVVS